MFNYLYLSRSHCGEGTTPVEKASITSLHFLSSFSKFIPCLHYCEYGLL